MKYKMGRYVESEMKDGVVYIFLETDGFSINLSTVSSEDFSYDILAQLIIGERYMIFFPKAFKKIGISLREKQ